MSKDVKSWSVRDCNAQELKKTNAQQQCMEQLENDENLFQGCENEDSAFDK